MRKLKCTWSRESSEDLRAAYLRQESFFDVVLNVLSRCTGSDVPQKRAARKMVAALTEAMAEELVKEIDQEILNDLNGLT